MLQTVSGLYCQRGEKMSTLDSDVPGDAKGLTVSGGTSPALVRPLREADIVDLGAEPSDEGQSLQLRRLHQYMRGYYRLATVLLMLGAAAGGFAGFKGGKKVYQSTGLIRVMPVVPKLMYSVEDKGALPMFDSFVESQVAVMQSQRVLGKAMEDPEWQSLGRGISDRSAEDYAAELNVSQQGGMLRVQALDPDPNAAMIDVKTLINAYLKIYDEEDALSGEKRLELLNNRRTELTRQLSTMKQQIFDIATVYGTDDLKSQFDFQQEQLNKLDIKIEQEQGGLAALARSSGTTRPVAVPLTEQEMASKDLELTKLLSDREEYKRRLHVDKANGGLSMSPAVEVDTQLVAENLQEIQQREEVLQTEHADGDSAVGSSGAAANQQTLAAEFNADKSERLLKNDKLTAIGTDMLKIKQLQNEANEIQADRDDTDRRIEQLQLESQITGRLDVISLGDRPLSAYRDTRISFSAAGGFGGGLLGFGLVAAFAVMDRRLRSPDQTEGGRINAPMLGMLPRLPENLSDPAQAVMAAHCVHEIRTLLQIWSRRSRHRVFAITSPNPGAGKTSLTMALGASYATANLRTLIVDCDLIGGGLTRRAELIIKRMLGQILLREGLITEEQLAEALKQASDSGKQIGEVLVAQGLITTHDLECAMASQIEQPVGILDAMHGIPIDQCVAPTSIPNLQILPIGAGTARDVPLLSPEALQQLIESLGRQFDVVLVDTGPILGSLEASLVAGIVDGVVLIVLKGDRQPAFERAMSQLVTVGARVAGVVFNGASPGDIVTYGRSSSARSRKDGVNGDGLDAGVAGAAMPGSYGPLTLAVANFAPAINRNSARS